MKKQYWTIDFENGKRMYVWAATVLTAIKLAVWGYNKDYESAPVKSSNIVKIQQGMIEED